ncbi:MAG: hypothetical protein KGR98_04925, partial [Verrucomicrobia bacterium]|nr:hypothetical protein [Verrucomicrobiota bacterium]
FFMVTLAVTGLPPFGIFQSEFNVLSGALAAHDDCMASLFVIGIVAIFAGFLIHVSNLCLGAPARPSPILTESPWQLTAMAFVSLGILGLAFWIPGWLYHLVGQSAQILGGNP